MNTKTKPFRGLHLWELALLAGLAAVLLTGALSLGEQTALSEKVVRLHVLANSDSQEDQALKLRVRDRVLAAGLSEGQVGLITEENQGYELRLKSVELWEKLKARFEGGAA